MAIYVSNITIEQGYDFDTSFQLEDTRTNEPLYLVGATCEAQLRKSYSSSRNARRVWHKGAHSRAFGQSGRFWARLAIFGEEMAILGHFWPKVGAFRAFLARFARCTQDIT